MLSPNISYDNKCFDARDFLLDCSFFSYAFLGQNEGKITPIGLPFQPPEFDEEQVGHTIFSIGLAVKCIFSKITNKITLCLIETIFRAES